MEFKMLFNAGDQLISTMRATTSKNDFGNAATIAARELFATEGVDNVTCFVIKYGNEMADEHFFYAEKG